MTQALLTPECITHVTDESVFLFTGREFGNMVPSRSPEGVAETNRQRAVQALAAYTSANTLITLSPDGGKIIDLDLVADQVEPYKADTLVTTNPDHILHMRPADCGAIAVTGFSLEREKPVIAAIHASREVLEGGHHLRALDYLVDVHAEDPRDLDVYFGPSAREASYKFEHIQESQKTSHIWRDFVRQDEAGLWHVDFHGLAVQSFLDYGVPAENITESTVDTAADGADYFSNMKFNKGIHPTLEKNGVFFAQPNGVAFY